MMKIYLAGRMRGIPKFNFPAFFAAADALRQKGHTVFNPAERDVNLHGEALMDNPTGDVSKIDPALNFSLRHALAADTQFICLEADAIALLPGWEQSKGATAEHALAVALGHEVITL